MNVTHVKTFTLICNCFEESKTSSLHNVVMYHCRRIANESDFFLPCWMFICCKTICIVCALCRDVLNIPVNWLKNFILDRFLGN